MTGMTSRRGLWAVLAPALVASSCSMVFRQPEVRFDGIRIGAIGMRGGTVHARFEVYNPNGYALRTAAIRYDLELSDGPTADPRWVRVASGTFDEPVRVASEDTTVVEVPIEFQYADLGGALRSILDRGSVEYRVSGDVMVSEPLSRTVPYRRTGTVDIIAGF